MVRGDPTKLSNHSSGTAIDLNATKHPLGKAGTFAAEKVPMIQALAKKYGLTWGGDYRNRKDEMHFEVSISAAKAAALIPFLSPSQYVPVDISVDFLREAADKLQASFPALDIVGLGMDFSSSLTLPDAVRSHDRVFFYPGSSLGNFSPPDALRFLQQIASSQQGNASGLLLGIDLVKDAAVLQAAYDDAAGVTAAFNKNVLLNVNALLGADFDLRQWRHVALFNLQDSRIEMHLEAVTNNTVRWAGHERSFAAGERIHTENSYKYTLDGISSLLKQAGFSHVQHWTDAQGWFGVFWASK
jgi:dimethylhistidine N-methyltransferase